MNEAPLGLRLLHYPGADLAGVEVVLDHDLSLGRACENAGALELSLDGKASRNHCAIAVKDGAAVATDLGSKNGTYVNAHRIHSPARLDKSDVLRIGDSLFEVDTLVRAARPNDLRGMIGRSDRFLACIARAEQLAKQDGALAIVGPPGCGKTMLVDFVHALSGRRGEIVTLQAQDLEDRTFASQLEAAFARAAGGTVCVDHVPNLSPELQAKLARQLDQKDPRGRVVVTSRDPLDGAIDPELRDQLGHRVLEVPALCDRRMDLLPLVQHFADEARKHDSGRDASTVDVVLGARVTQWPVDLLERIIVHRWPRNVRELASLVGRLVLAREASEVDAIVRELGRVQLRKDQGRRSHAMSKQKLVEILQRHKGNMRAVAEEMGLDRRQVYRWLERYGLSADSYRVSEDEVP